jgi:hypothetical protein
MAANMSSYIPLASKFGVLPESASCSILQRQPQNHDRLTQNQARGRKRHFHDSFHLPPVSIFLPNLTPSFGVSFTFSENDV